MQAVIFNSYGSVDVLRIADIATPSPQADQRLVRIRAAAVNPKDTFIRKGRFQEFTGRQFPMQTGFDFAGEVASSGSQGDTIAPGTPVFGMIEGWQGQTCAQYAAVHTNQLVAKPPTLTFEAAAALPLVSLTALQALRDEGGLQPGQRVCINGAAGGVGSMAVQIARILGASVTAISSAGHHEFLRQLGADTCIDYRTTAITESRQPFDLFFDVFGNHLFNTVRPILTPQGIYVSTVLRPEVFAAIAQTQSHPGPKAKLVIVHADAQDLTAIAEWCAVGRLKPIVQEVFPMARIAAAHQQQESKHTRGKIVVAIP
jgi:NADPH:quinone reductase-like Zn-dependent oxidoreductase